jgi:hypothetical protein
MPLRIPCRGGHDSVGHSRGTVQAQTLAPAGIFGYHIRYVVPLFQRPYVWKLDEQWQPLWEDVRTIAERLLDAPAGFGTAPVPPHFLGAIVLDQQFIPAGFIAVRHVVDGQQRLTTLQLLLDVAQYVVEQHGAAMDAEALRVLVLNDPRSRSILTRCSRSGPLTGTRQRSGRSWTTTPRSRQHYVPPNRAGARLLRRGNYRLGPGHRRPGQGTVTERLENA